MKMELFPKNFNAGHWSTQYTSGDMPMLSDLQWSTWCLEIPPNC